MSKSDFCRSFPWHDFDIEWLDLSGVIQLDKDRRAVVSLANSGTQGDYDAFDVKIVSKTHGPIEQKRFLFRDYLNIKQRKDTRSDYLPLTFKVIESCGWKWYIAEPKDTKPLVSAIEKFIGLFL